MSPAPVPVMVDLRLLPPALCAWGAALAATGGLLRPLPALVTAVLAIGVGALLSASRWVSERRRPRGGAHALTPAGSLRHAGALCALAAAAALVVGSAAWEAHARDPLVALRDAGVETVRVRCVLLSDPSPLEASWGGGRHGVDVRVREVAPANAPPTGAASPSSVRMLAQGSGWGSLARGDVVEVVARIDSSFRSAPPWAGTLRGDDPRLVRRPGGWVGAVRTVRTSLQSATLGLSGQARALVPGMALGDDRLLDPDLGEAMRTSSLTHLTAVSGSHVALVLAVVVWVVPGRGWARAGAAVATMAVLVAVVGPEPSVVRSVSTAGVGVWGLLARRPGQAHSALFAVALAVLLVDPWSSRSFGFLLSVLATWGVVGPAATWVRRSRSGVREDTRAGRVLRRVVGVAAVPVAAQVVASPVLLLLNPWLSTWGVLANVAAAPAVAPASLLGLGAAAAGPWWPGGAHALAQASGVFTGWIAGCGTFFASLPLARLPWPGGWPGAVVLVATLVLAVLALRVLRVLRARVQTGSARGTLGPRRQGDAAQPP